jgi:hypothetical protein
MRLTSPRTTTSVILPNSRLRLLERSRLLWPAPSLPPPCVRISLPRPLYLNRLAAPLYVLILGMVSSSFGMITALQAITKGQSAFPVPPQRSVETPFVLWVMPRARYPFSANHFSSRAPISDRVCLPDTARQPPEPQKALHSPPDGTKDEAIISQVEHLAKCRYTALARNPPSFAAATENA